MAFVKHQDTIALEALLRKLEVGQSLTWEELSASIGADCSPGGVAYVRLQSARNALLNDRIVIGTVARVGVKRMSDTDIAEHAQSDVATVRRAARKSLKRLASVREFDKLTDEHKRQHLVASAQLGAIHEFSKPSATKRIASAVKTSEPLALGKTLELFGVKAK